MKRLITIIATISIVLLTTTTAHAAALTKKTTPPSCVQALAIAREVNGITADYAGAVSDYLSNLGLAAQRASNEGGTTAATTTFLTTQAALIKTLNTTVEALLPRIESAASRFQTAEARCLAGK